jgi:hypothetical protein
MSAPSKKLEPSPLRVTLVHGQRAPYEMFDVDSVGAEDVRVRGPMLLEVGEEVQLRIERGGQSAIIRARVSAHDVGTHGGGHDAVTTLSLVGDTAVVRRLIAG